MAPRKKPAPNGATNGNGSTATALALPDGTMYRHEAFAKARSLAVEEYNQHRTQQQVDLKHFQDQYGRIDRIDKSYADDIRRLLVRTLAIARTKGTGTQYRDAPDVKIQKLAVMLSDMLSVIELQLATDNVQGLFDRIDEAQYLQNGYQRAGVGDDPSRWVGEKATAATEFLASIKIVDEPKPTTKERKATAADLEIAEKNAAETIKADAARRNAAAMQETAQAGCDHGVRVDLEEDDHFDSDLYPDESVIFTHECALCNATVANYDGAWYTERTLDDLSEARETAELEAEARREADAASHAA